MGLLTEHMLENKVHINSQHTAEEVKYCCIPVWYPTENVSQMSFSGGCRVRTLVKVEQRWLLVSMLARYSKNKGVY
jgi:hypothetical protein